MGNSRHLSSSLGSSSSPSSSSSSGSSLSSSSSSRHSSNSRGSHLGGQTTLIPEGDNQLPSSSSSPSSNSSNSSSSSSSNSSSRQAHRRQLTCKQLRLRSRRLFGCRAVWQTQEMLDVNSQPPSSQV